ncbi:TRAP transporter substrate-binding protein [Tistrella mobilis]|jgi:TRAP-type C4-dicarboxylate transport system substrate-binding protein|uniref:TRAP transporter substrate-binding protein n=1 Tax=Tistrella mobilis TaxID=171437 RepID=UPI00355902D7
MRGFIAAAFGAALTIAGLGGGVAPAAAQETVTLKISHYLPASHGFQTDFLGPWAEELARRTNGKVKAEIYPGTSSFGNAARQADQVRAGVIDIALGLRGIPRGRFERSSVFELPFVVSEAGAGTKAMWEMYKSGALADDYKEYKVLALFVHNGGLFHTTSTPVRELSDLKGLRLRTPSEAVSVMLQSLGASAVGLPPSEIYENLQKGTLDGLVTTWDLVGATRLNEVVKYHTDGRVYTAAFYVLMNQRKYDSLPADVKQAIDETSGDALVAKFGDWWAKWDKAGREDAVARGHEIIEVDEATRNRWRQELTPMIDAYIERLQSTGVADARALYDQARDLTARYEAAE